MPLWTRRSGIQLCSPFEEKRLLRWKAPFVYCQPKLDGERCRAIIQRKEVQLLSSEENEILSVPHINYALSDQLGHMDFIELDGELYKHGLSFEQIHSRVSRKKTLHDDYSSIEYHVFDIAQATAGGTAITQEVRILLLDTLREVVSHPIHIVPYTTATNVSTIEDQMNSYMAEGFEGIVVRHPSAIYERKRSLWVMKYKEKATDVYKIIGVEEEIDQYGTPKGQIGAIWCQDDMGTRFKVSASKTPHGWRRRGWKDRDLLPGLYLTVYYQNLTDKKVPRHGRTNLALDLSASVFIR